MPKLSERFDPQSVEWRRISDPREPGFKIDFEYSLLGYDLPSGRLDMLLRFSGNGGHCRRHRHIASTVTLVLEGEQHVTEIREDGSRETVVRRQGDYALASTDALPHLERGGPEGGTLLLSMQAPDGRLFEYFDRDMKSVRVLTIEEYVESWNEGTAYGASEAEVA
ncbi:MAG: hypothetical protein VW709_10670 [Rickettsiales bacterium]